MTNLFIVLIAMLMSACLIVIKPFASRRNRRFRPILYPLITFMVLSTAALFYLSGGTHGWAFWETKGRAHYQLLQEVKQLGGIDGMIARIKNKLKVSPDDAQGWAMLGKLYLFKEDKGDARDAFTRAVGLQPDNAGYQKLLSDTSK